MTTTATVRRAGPDDAEAFASQWLQAYRDREQEAELSSTIVTRPGTGACRVF